MSALSLKVNKRNKLKKYVSQAYISVMKYYWGINICFLNTDNLYFMRKMLFTATEYHK